MKNRTFEHFAPRATPNGRSRSSPPGALLHDLETSLREQASHWGRALSSRIRRSPGASIAVALGCGAVIGWIVKRR